jgi:hypothetical protein
MLDGAQQGRRGEQVGASVGECGEGRGTEGKVVEKVVPGSHWSRMLIGRQAWRK